MKKIYSILLTATALLALAPAVRAQYSINDVIKDSGNNNANPVYPEETDTGVHTDATNKVAYSKNISQPFSDGTYWIKLETFATGSAAQTVSSVPSDIILVLDYSSSMNESYGGTVSYTARSSQGYSYQSYGTNDYYYYMESDDEYYAVTRGGNGSGQARYLTFTDKNGKPWYLNNYAGYTGRARLENTYYTEESGLMEDQPTMSNTNGPDNNNLGCWSGVLYERRVTGAGTRLDALKSACQAFLTKVYSNDNDARSVDTNYGGDRVAIMSFNSGGNRVYSLSQINSQYTTMYNYFGGNIGTANYTNPAPALELAMAQWQDEDGNPTIDETRNRAVVIFTDGCPSHHYSYAFDCDYAEAAVDNANTLKSEYGASVYTIGLFNTSDLTNWSPIGQSVIDYMNFMSSNFTGVTASSTMPASGGSNAAGVNGTITYTVPNYNPWTDARSADAYADQNEALAGESDFFFMASDDPSSLNAIFEHVASQSSGTANQSLSSATSNVDIVSNSFILPDGVFEEDADLSDYVKIFTAKLNKIENGKYIFDTEVLVDHSEDTYYALDDNGVPTGEPLDVDAGIGVELVGTNGIKVTGFDYSANFCGPVYKPGSTTEIDHYQGHEIIIMIPIKMNPDAVGGPNVATNADGSGIVLEGEDDPLVPFESPTVSLPVNIHFKKTGLEPGESAKFMIERAIIPNRETWTVDDEDLDWKYVSSVFVTRGMGSSSEAEPIVKVRGMPSTTTVDGKQRGYVYRVSEEDWAWSYERDKAPQYTTTDNVENPFVFDNDKKEDIDVKVRHAESKANNIFKPGVSKHIVYTDSKTNEGTGRY
ncbi:MAG: VWA domain-containing protein [Bacteroidales bacterium]|nr:VWA domain-containing protein [Bacteroidales bacterium]